MDGDQNMEVLETIDDGLESERESEIEILPHRDDDGSGRGRERGGA